MNTNKLLAIRDVVVKTATPKSSIYLFMTRNQFPRPIKTGPKQVRWVESEIDQWIESRIVARG